MTAITANRVNAFLNNPPENFRAILIHGSDRGLVNERAGALAKKFIGQSDNELSITRLTSGDLELDPGRLSDEATSIGLFGGKRAVRVRPEKLQIADQIENVLERIPDDILVIVEAGQLTPSSKLRKMFEASPACAALPCYSDGVGDLKQIIIEHLQKSGLGIDSDAVAALSAQLGSDRQATRSELDKLALYCFGQDQVSLADIADIISDTSMLNIDDLCDSSGLGRLQESDLLLQRLLQSNVAPDRILAGINRHYMLLHELRNGADTGGRPDDMVARHRPPIFFKRKAAVINQCRIWRLPDLNRALEIIGKAEWQIRQGDGLARETISTAILTICARAASIIGRSRAS